MRGESLKTRLIIPFPRGHRVEVIFEGGENEIVHSVTTYQPSGKMEYFFGDAEAADITHTGTEHID